MRPAKTLLALLALSAASGCATLLSDSHPLVGPDGGEHELVSCAYLDACYTRAREVCGGNYQIVNSNSDVEGYKGSTGTSFNVLIKCASGHAASVTAQAVIAGARTPAQEFPDARSFADCDSYESLQKDRCREAVYAHRSTP